jgi:hypothetical protein
MQIICAWCGKFIREKKPLGNRAISHSICDECYERVIDEIKRFKEQEDVGEEKKSKCKKEKETEV